MENDGQAPEADSQDVDVVALIEQSLVAVRHDQSRHRIRGGPGAHGIPGGHGPWPDGFGHGPHGGHGGHGWGGPGDAQEGSERNGSRGSAFAGGFPAFGDSGRPGPGRRGRPDGSLGRAARFRMLDVLEAAERDGATYSISTLAPAIGVDQPRASRLVQEAVDRGLVSRVTDPADARRTLIQLTTAGRKQIAEVRSHRRSAVEQALSAFTPEEAKTFAELFARFVRAWPRE